MENCKRRKTPSTQANGGVGNRGIEEYKRLLASALKLLSFRPRSCKEITQYLQTKTSNAQAVEQVVFRLKQENFLDDFKFASWLVDSYSRSKPKGKSFFNRILKEKGIASEIIDKVMPNSDKEIEIGRILLAKKSIIWRHLTPQKYRQKAFNYLYSRGFVWNTIEQILNKGYNDHHVNSDND